MKHVPIVRASDHRYGIIASVAFTIFVLLMLFFITFNEPDPPKVTIPIPIVMSEIGLDDFQIEASSGGSSPSETTESVAIPEESPKDQATQEESDVQVDKGTGEADSRTQTNTTEEVANPFSGNSNGANGTTSGSGFGPDAGPNSGGGFNTSSGGSNTRVRLNDIKTKPKTVNNVPVLIALKLVVDWRGVVLRAEYIRQDSTTDNQPLIDEVIDLTKKEVVYKERKEGTPNEVVYYTVRLTPEGSYVR